MLQRILAVAALSAAISASLAPSSAEAGERWRLKFFLPQFYSYEEDDIYAYEPDFEDERYYEPEYMNPDDEPDYVAPKKKSKKKLQLPLPNLRSKRNWFQSRKNLPQQPLQQLPQHPRQ